ncbi:MAG TPA: SMC-Scp complex subunit ScpB [Desulfosarcina sp.]|nr:SMC-Scp complex subunit ScpB [Desulfosarcina sp.]
MADELKHIIESLLFVSDAPLTMDHLKGILEGEETAAIREAVDALIVEYAQRDGGYVLKQVAGGYQFRTQGRYNEWIKRLVKPNAPRLSRAALETLAIVAYNQPIIRSDIEHIRGVDSGGVLRMLMERKLIRVLGRKEIPGRPLIYATAKHFLDVFELKDLKDLPTPKEIEELGKSRLDDPAEDDPLPEATSDAPPAVDDAGESDN